jgi:hypothetical protein
MKSDPYKIVDTIFLTHDAVIVKTRCFCKEPHFGIIFKGAGIEKVVYLGKEVTASKVMSEIREDVKADPQLWLA